MFPVQHRPYHPGIDNLLVLLIGGIPIAMPTVLSVTMAIGSRRLAEQVGCNRHGTFIALTDHFYMVNHMYGLSLIIIAGSYHQKNDSNRRNGGDGCALQ